MCSFLLNKHKPGPLLVLLNNPDLGRSYFIKVQHPHLMTLPGALGRKYVILCVNSACGPSRGPKMRICMVFLLNKRKTEPPLAFLNSFDPGEVISIKIQHPHLMSLPGVAESKVRVRSHQRVKSTHIPVFVRFLRSTGDYHIICRDRNNILCLY